ncbi:MAG: hypothetical protein AB7E37_05850 [Candidatus Altimarinota bacterium]
MFRLIFQINGFIRKISKTIGGRKYAWIFHTSIWIGIIYSIFYVVLNVIVIGFIILTLVILSFLLNSLYEYLKEKGFKKIAISVLVSGIILITSLLSFVIYNYPKVNNWIIEKSKIISESIPLSKRGLIKDVNQGIKNGEEKQSIIKEVKVGTGGLELELNQ